MNRLALLFTTTTFFAATQPAVAQDSQSLTFADNPGICMVRPLADARPLPDTWEWGRRAEIRAGTEGVCANFDGAFTLVPLDEDDGSQTGVIVDRTDGKIYWLPARATQGYEFHSESNQLVVNAFISRQFDSPADVPLDVWRSFYVFEHGRWILKFQDKGFFPSME